MKLAAIALAASALTLCGCGSTKVGPGTFFIVGSNWEDVWMPNWLSAAPAVEQSVAYAHFNDEGEAQLASLKQSGSPPDPIEACQPPGMPRLLVQPYPIEFLFTTDRITIISEAFGQVRRIYMDGRKVPRDLEPTTNGYSVGHWEDTTLVVRTYGIKTDTPIFAPAPVGLMRHTEQLRITERYSLISDDRMEARVTIEDPGLYSRPLDDITLVWSRRPNWDIQEFDCKKGPGAQSPAVRG